MSSCRKKRSVIAVVFQLKIFVFLYVIYCEILITNEYFWVSDYYVLFLKNKTFCYILQLNNSASTCSMENMIFQLPSLLSRFSSHNVYSIVRNATIIKKSTFVNNLVLFFTNFNEENRGRGKARIRCFHWVPWFLVPVLRMET